MGLFGKNRDPALGDRIRAAIAMMQGDPAAASRFQQLQIERQRLAATQQQAQQEQAQREAQIWGAKERGVPVDLLSSMTSGDLSQYVRERSGLQRFDAGGGSILDPNTGQWTIAPSEREVNGAIVRTGPGADGTSNVRYDGGHYVPVTEGGGVAVFNHQGQGGWGVAPDALGGQGVGPPRLGPVGAPQIPPQTGAALPPQLPPAAEGRADGGAFDFTARPTPAGPPPSAPRHPAALGDPVREMSALVGVQPSSGYRTQRHQNSLVEQGLTRARHSQHTEGNAIDFPIPSGPAQQAAAARIRQRYPQARFEFERSNLHVSLPGWGGAPDISGSRRRYPDGGGGGIPLIRTPAEAARLRPGTQFRTPDGQIRTRN